MRRAFVAALLGLTLLACKKQRPSEAASLEDSAAEAGPRSRCSTLGEPFVVGERDVASEDEDERLLPFSAEVGEAVVHDAGFAASATFFRGKEKIAGIVFVDRDGKGARFVELGPVRGDVGPSQLAAKGSSLFVAVLEPANEGRLIRLGKVEGTKTSFGGSVVEKRDESLAFDLAVGESSGLLAWDEESPQGGAILVVPFHPETAAIKEKPRAISEPSVVAESPRLLPHRDGFVLAYVARRAGADAAANEDQFETEERGFRAIEAVFLDEKGERQGPVVAVTAREAHVAAFDMATLPDGRVAIAWREDDGPSGSGGGRVLGAIVQGDAVTEPIVLAEEKVGSGAPSIAARWLAISDAADVTRLGKLSPSFTLEGSLDADPTIGQGEVLAAEGDVVLVAKPRGKTIHLLTLRCEG